MGKRKRFFARSSQPPRAAQGNDAESKERRRVERCRRRSRPASPLSAPLLPGSLAPAGNGDRARPSRAGRGSRQRADKEGTSFDRKSKKKEAKANAACSFALGGPSPPFFFLSPPIKRRASTPPFPPTVAPHLRASASDDKHRALPGVGSDVSGAETKKSKREQGAAFAAFSFFFSDGQTRKQTGKRKLSCVLLLCFAVCQTLPKKATFCSLSLRSHPRDGVILTRSRCSARRERPKRLPLRWEKGVACAISLACFFSAAADLSKKKKNDDLTHLPGRSSRRRGSPS